MILIHVINAIHEVKRGRPLVLGEIYVSVILLGGTFSNYIPKSNLTDTSFGRF